MASLSGDRVRLFLCGDVMLGRGVDQILPHPGDPELRESYVRDARGYVELAEAATGPIPKPVDFDWPWGEALPVLEETAPDVRVVNLETAVTRSADFAPGKAVHYRMSPENVPCLAAAEPDVCVLANNHVLDFGMRGLGETLAELARAGLRTAGAGLDADAAQRPAVVEVAGGVRVVVHGLGMPSSGIPPSWAATPARPGVFLVPDLSDDSADAFTRHAREGRRDGDVVVASLHWGSNWGYDVPGDRVRFAHRLVDGGIDVVHGHSSHHPRPIEVYRGKLVLYGCGDFIDDYEGISGHEEYRPDARLMYLPTVDPATGRVTALRMLSLQSRGMRLGRASDPDVRAVHSILQRISGRFRTGIDLGADGWLALRVPGGRS